MKKIVKRHMPFFEIILKTRVLDKMHYKILNFIHSSLNCKIKLCND